MNPFFNSSPLIFLDKLTLLDTLLPKLWNKIYIPKAVIQEINDTGITAKPFFQEYEVKNKVALMALPPALHKGEAEVIVGAMETGINFVVLDDMKARKRARSMGIQTMGTLGIFILAVEKKVMGAEEAVIYLDKLREQAFWVSDELFTEIIAKLRKTH